MSEQTNGDSGSKDRATVAMVLRTVDDLKELTAVQFSALHARLNNLDRLPDQVNALHERVVLDEARILRLEEAERNSLSAVDQSKLYRRGTLPMLVLTAVATTSAVVATFHPFG